MVTRCTYISILIIAFISTILLIIGTSTLPSKPAITYRVVHKLRTPFQGVLNIAYNPMMASMLQQRTPKGGS
jgi:hypothetical protein